MTTPSQPVLKACRRINPVAQYLLALAAVISAYSFYAMYAVPILEGPPAAIQKRVIRARSAAQPRVRNKAWLKALLPSDAWELESCKTLVTSQGTILFRDYQPRDDGYADVFPFTLVMNASPPDASLGGSKTDGDPAQHNVAPPVILRCLREAKLKFDRPLKLGMGGGRLKMESARLVGHVTVYRPESAPGKRDAVSIVTSNIQINESQIFTLEDVKFAFGPNYGQGRHLTIDLTHKQPYRGVPHQFNHVTGVRSIELAKLNKLRLEPSNDMEFTTTGTTGTAASEDTSLFSAQRAPLEISCEGSFAFNVETNKASFRDSVLVEQMDQHRDSIRCDLLTLAFAPQSQPALADGSATSSALHLQNFRAQGSPAEIVSRSRMAKILGDDIQFEVSTRRFEAQSADEVVLISPEFQLVAKQLKYTLPPDRSLGPVDAVGPGKLLRHATEEQDAFYLEWTNELLVRLEAGQQLVSIDGGARMKLGNDTNVRADQLRLWLSQIALADEIPATGDDSSKVTWEPSKLKMQGNVQIESPQLSGVTETLNAFWQAETIGRQANQPPKRLSNAKQNRRHFAGRISNPQWSDVNPPSQPLKKIRQPFAVAQHRPTGSVVPVDYQTPVEKPPRKLDFRGDQVDIRLQRNVTQTKKTKTQIVDLEVDGNVEIVESAATRREGVPMKVTGQHLRLTPQTEELYRLQVSGTGNRLATLRANGLRLDGREVYLDQLKNKLWVEGSGEVTFDSSAKRPAASSSSATQMGRNRDLRVSFVGGMIFDGRRIYFEKDVAMESNSQPDAKGVTTKSRSFSQGLSIELANAISFQNLSQQSKQPKIEVVEIVLVDRLDADKRVFQLAKHQAGQTATMFATSNGSDSGSLLTPIVIENQTIDSNGRLTEQQTVIVPQATFDVTNGDIRAKGPGALLIHRVGSSGLLVPPGNQTAKQGDTRQGLTLTHIKFDGTLTANSQQKQMQIVGGVRSVTSPVQTMQESVDPDQDVSTWPVDAVKLICDRVQLAQWSPRGSNVPSGTASNELIATGNAHITSSTFEATADRVSYSQATDMLVVEGTPRSDANLWFRQKPNARPDHLVARKILYRLSDQWTEVQSVRNVSIKGK